MNDLELKYQEILDNLPEDELLDFDPFLVGDGSEHLLNRSQRSRSTSQLVGIFSVSDLREDKKVSEDLTRYNDLEDWGNDFEFVKVDVKDYFYEQKKKAYEVFDYIKVKSEKATGLVKEADLVMAESDHYLLEYLKGSVEFDKSLVKTLAQLSAYMDIGFREVKFYKECDCSLCSSNDRVVYEVVDLFQKISSGIFPVHKFCYCNYIPVIRVRNEFVTIPEIEINGTLYVNFPCEFREFVEDFSLDYKRVEFRDLAKVDGWNGEALVDRGDHLLVHCNYLGNFSPIEFLEYWVSEEELKESSDEILMYKGKQIQLVNGRYIDITTGEIVEV